MQRKNLLTRFLLLLAVVLGGVTGAWAEDVTFNYEDYNGQGTQSSGSEYTMVKTDVSITNTKFYGNNSYAHFYAGGTTTITPTTGVTITKIVLTASATNYNGYQSSGTVTASTGEVSGSTSSTTVTWEGSATSAFTISNNKQIRWTSIVVTYTAGTKTDPTITFDNGSVKVGKTLDLSTLFDSNSNGAVTYSITNGSNYATISGSTLTGVAEGSVTVKAEQEAAGSYNAGEATATITVEAALALSSIAITTAPTKTTYTAGETFDPTGMVVTATYSDNSTDDVTALCTYSPNGALATTDTEITVSYTENNVTKTATQAITVNIYTQPTTVEFNITQAMFTGVTFNSSNQTTESSISATVDKVQMTLNKGNSNIYVKDGEMRQYANGTLVFEAPDGYDLVGIEFTKGSSWGMSGADSGTLDGQTWTSDGVSSVTFSFSGRTDITKVVVTLEAHTVKYAFNFAASPVAGGTIVAIDANADDVASGDKFAEGAELTVEATAAEGYSFTNWTATGVTLADATQAEQEITMPANEVTLTANFTLNTYSLNVTSAHGTVAVTVDDVAWNGTDKIAYGAEVELTATANTDWAFSSWTATGVTLADASQNPVTFNMPATDVSIEAGYADASTSYTVTYYVAGVEAEVQRTGGTALNLDAPTAPTGMVFAGWSESATLTETPTLLNNSTTVSGDMTLYAVFTTVGGTTYVKQTSGTVSGDYLIVYEEGAVAFDGSLTTLDAESNVVEVTIANGVIASSANIDAAIFTINATAGTLQSASGKYIGVSGNSNGLKQTDEPDGYSNTFSIDEYGNAVIAAAFENSTMTLRFNKASNQNRFRYYKNNGQEDIALYKKVVTPTTYSLGTSISVSVNTTAEYATFSDKVARDFSGTGITVYTAKAKGTSVSLTEVEDGIVPANTGVVLYKENGTTDPVAVYDVATDLTSLENNEMVANVERAIVAWDAGEGKYNYILSNETSGVGFYKATENGAYLNANRAYLSTATTSAQQGAPFLGFDGNGETTGISNVNVNLNDNQWYDLNGRRIENPTKGVYIMNGKKVIVK